MYGRCSAVARFQVSLEGSSHWLEKWVTAPIAELANNISALFYYHRKQSLSARIRAIAPSLPLVLEEAPPQLRRPPPPKPLGAVLLPGSLVLVKLPEAIPLPGSLVLAKLPAVTLPPDSLLPVKHPEAVHPPDNPLPVKLPAVTLPLGSPLPVKHPGVIPLPDNQLPLVVRMAIRQAQQSLPRRALVNPPRYRHLPHLGHLVSNGMSFVSWDSPAQSLFF
ncbi:hypothetical protein BDP67DRAFT_564312 [Colletotrichum lupini]|nr:hypothetical protein BDP67DRAFT_564312 [Colletotrichum lupini]